MSDIPVEIPAEGDGFDSLGSEYDELLSSQDDTIGVPRSQLQRYADEHKKYRQKWGETAREWQGAPPDDVKAMAAFYRAVTSGDPVAIKQASEWANAQIDALTPAEAKAVKEAIKEEAAETGKTQKEVKASLTPEDIERIIEEKAAEKAAKVYEEKRKAEKDEDLVNQNLQKLQSVAKALADETGLEAWADPQHPIYGMLIQATSRVMNQDGSTDLEAAMRKAAPGVLEILQGANAALLSKKKQTAGAGAKPSPQRGTEPVGQSKPTTFAEAAERARARFESELGR